MTKQARFIGEYPKVGIRPVIDGRQGGVRESLLMVVRVVCVSRWKCKRWIWLKM